MSNSNRLADLRLKRDAIESNLGTPKGYVEVTIGGKTVRVETSTAVLTRLDSQIEIEERKLNATARGGHARNKVVIKR